MLLPLHLGRAVPVASQYWHTLPGLLAAHVACPMAHRTRAAVLAVGGVTPEPEPAGLDRAAVQAHGTRLPTHLEVALVHCPTSEPEALRT